MNRRSILKSLVAAPAAAALHAQTPPREPPPGAPVEDTSKIETAVPDSAAEPVSGFFTRDQFATLARLCEILEPSSATLPGARQAHTAEFLDFLLSQSPLPRQTLYRTGLDHLNAASAQQFHRPFAALDEQQAAAVLEPLRRPWTYEDPADDFERFLREAKADVGEATRNSFEFISVASKRSRSASGIGDFWYPIY